MSLAGGSSAQSAGPGVNLDMSCWFTGHANVFAPVKWVGGGGAFGFDSEHAFCSGQYHLIPFAELANIAASGVYTSLVCGTSNPLSGAGTPPTAGAALGNANLAGFPIVGPPVSGNATFAIPFVAGQGVMTGRFDTASGDVRGATLGGYVTIFPNPPDAINDLTTGGNPNSPPGPPPAGTCVDNYGVVGTFSVSG